MDPRERYVSPAELMRAAMETHQSHIWTAVPAVVQSFNADEMTVEAQPVISCLFRNPDGTRSYLALPMLADVPVVWQGGGGVTATFPIAAGDECLVVIASRCIDAWWSQGLQSPQNVPPPPEVRMHNLSDGFAIVGLRSLPRVLSGLSTDSAQLRSDDGETYYDLNPTAKTFKVVAPNGITLNGVGIDSSGNITNADSITASGMVTGTTDVKAGSGGTGISLMEHTHTSASPGSPTSPPIAGT
jgi:hypothetical protein